MQAIGHELYKNNPQLKIKYFPAENFANELISALKSKNMNRFKEKYRQADCILVDDVQFIAGKEYIQEEFFHTFNALHMAGKQVVLTSDRKPSDINPLEDRLVSRFMGGLTVDIQLPDYEMRLAIINQKAQEKGINLDSTAAAFLAENIVSNIRDIEGRLRSMLLSKLQDLLGETAAGKSVAELIGLTEEIGAAVRAKAQDDFAAIGLLLKSFYIANLKPSDKSAEELRAMGMLDMQTYTQLQAADALREAARNESGGAGLTAGIGAGMGLGEVISQSLQGMTGPAAGAAAAGTSQPSGGTGSLPAVMTPSEAASVLRVSEEDVVAAITAGDLKARKIGSAYRISKEALEEFLKG